MNVSSIIVLCIVAALFGKAVIRSKDTNKSGCPGNCAECEFCYKGKQK